MSLKVEQIDLRFLYTFKNFSSFSFNFNFSPFFNSEERILPSPEFFRYGIIFRRETGWMFSR